MIDRKPGGGVELLNRPTGDSGEKVPSRAQAGRHAPVRTTPEQGHGVAPVRRDCAHGAVPGPLRSEDDDLCGVITCARAAAPRGAELNEDRPGVTRGVALGDGPDPGSRRRHNPSPFDPAEPPDLPGRLLRLSLGPGVDAGPWRPVEDGVHDAIVAQPQPGGAARGPAARRPHAAYAQGAGEVVPAISSAAADCMARPSSVRRAALPQLCPCLAPPARSRGGVPAASTSRECRGAWPPRGGPTLPFPSGDPACRTEPARTWVSRPSPWRRRAKPSTRSPPGWGWGHPSSARAHR